MTTNLAINVARGGGITLAGQIAKLGLLLVNLAVLGRLLTPQDFGLIAMVMAIVGIAELLRDFGLSSAAIQSRDLSQGQKSNLFWINTALGLGLGSLVLALSPVIAGIYGDMRLVGITCVVASVFVLGGVQTQFQVELTRRAQYGVLAITDVVSQVVGLSVGIIVAVAGGGYWALVALQVSAALTLCVARVSYAKWVPSRPSRDSDIRPFLKYGLHLGLAQALNYVSINAASVILGLNASAKAVGIYSRASQVVSVPINQFFGPLTNVALPSLARIDDDHEYFSAVVRLQFLLAYAGAIGFSLLSVIAEPFVAVLLGPQWMQVVPLVQILSIGAAFQCITFVTFWVFLSRAITKSMLIYNVVTKSIIVAAVVVGAQSGGAIGVAFGYSFGLVLTWPISLYWLYRAIGLRSLTLLRGGLRPLCVALATTSCGLLALWGVGSEGNGWQYLAGILAWGLAAGAFWLLVPWFRRDVRELMKSGRMMLRFGKA